MSAVMRMRTLTSEPSSTGYSQCSADAARESANPSRLPSYSFSALNLSEVSKRTAESLKNVFAF